MRRFRAAVLLASLAFALSAAFWHHDHDASFPPSARDSGPGFEGDRTRAREIPAAGRTGGCPVCLTQRMLSQLSVERVPETGVLADGAIRALPSAQSTAPAPVRSRSARAPPRT